MFPECLERQTLFLKAELSGRIFAAWLVTAVYLCLAPPVTTFGADDSIEFFEARIRPVLIQQCYSCHNSRDRREGGLALDSRDAMLAGGDSGELIFKGNAAESFLLAVLRHEVAGLEMPQDGAKLDDQVLADFERWIRLGAPDPRDHPPSETEWESLSSWSETAAERLKWWSFQPIADVQPPNNDSNRWNDHPIDRFIFQKLAEVGLAPAVQASAADLVRRAYLMLTGLPPSHDEAQAWTKRLATTAEFDRVYEECVDHLIDQPSFGERWARHWMDWIRYAESHGSEGDPVIDQAWQYRDYLIRAFNQDVPIDQLIREHIAGDLLKEPRWNQELQLNESIVGTAHWRMVFHGFSPTDPLEEKVRFIDDQVNAVSKAFLGLTLSCARCHDHKFDPISQKDYYATFGILASTRPGRALADTSDRLALHQQELQHLKNEIREALVREWLDQLTLLERRGAPTVPGSSATEESMADLRSLIAKIQSRLNAGLSFESAWYEVASQLRDQLATYRRVLRVDGLTSWDFSGGHSLGDWTRTGNGLTEGVSASGSFAIEPSGSVAVKGIYPAGVYSHLLSQKHAARLASRHVGLIDGKYEIWVEAIGDAGATCRYAVHDFPRDGTIYPVTKLTPQWRWHRFDVSLWTGEQIHLELANALDAPLLVTPSPRSWFGVRRAKIVPLSSPFPQESVEHFEPILDLAQSQSPKDFGDLHELYRLAIRDALNAWWQDKISDAQALLLDAAIRSGWLSNQLVDLPRSAELIERFRDLEADVLVPTRVPTLEEAEIRDHPLYIRGDHKKPGIEVPRRFLEFMSRGPYDSSSSGRLQLAEDLLRDDNPLTRRVLVNRIWQQLFGQGIVRTTDNFGRLGDTPSHPELLDWLAREFELQHWSLKSFIKTIVTSKAWRQSTQPSRRALEIDPENRLLSHFHLRRLEAEAIRDSILAVSGTLDVTLAGPPVDGLHDRRSIYVRVHRNSLDPFLRAFDFPEPFSSVGHRMVTNVPAQALALMNDELIEGCASRWAKTLSAMAEKNTERTVVEHLYWQALGRSPTESECQSCIRFLNATREAVHDQQRQADALRQRLTQLQSEIEELYQRAIPRLLDTGEIVQSDASIAPKPVLEWDFTTAEGREAARGMLHGLAVFDEQGLVLEGGYWISGPLGFSIGQKSLEVWLMMEQLEQSGGGALSLQTLDGSQFDAIVFGETDPGKWIAGSDFHRRTQRFLGDQERDATSSVVQVVLTYDEDGTITAYRNGKRYGQAYQKGALTTFPAEKSVITVGLRHLPASDGKMFHGRVFRGLLYDRSLSDDEVEAAWQANWRSGRMRNWETALTEEERSRLDKIKSERREAESALSRFQLPESADRAAWIELARNIFCLKEFIYVR